jgi:hypothetical protein
MLDGDTPNAVWPSALTPVKEAVPRTPVPFSAFVSDIRELTPDDMALAEELLASGVTLPAIPTIRQMRQSHHRAAQLMVALKDDVAVAAATNYSPATIRSFRQDPAFQELLAHYGAERDARWADFIEEAKTFSLDIMAELRTRMEEKPEQFTIAHLNDLMKTISDRAGYAPVSKSVQVNVNHDIGQRLQAARARRRALATAGAIQGNSVLTIEAAE